MLCSCRIPFLATGGQENQCSYSRNACTQFAPLLLNRTALAAGVSRRFDENDFELDDLWKMVGVLDVFIVPRGVRKTSFAWKRGLSLGSSLGNPVYSVSKWQKYDVRCLFLGKITSVCCRKEKLYVLEEEVRCSFFKVFLIRKDLDAGKLFPGKDP